MSRVENVANFVEKSPESYKKRVLRFRRHDRGGRLRQRIGARVAAFFPGICDVHLVT